VADTAEQARPRGFVERHGTKLVLSLVFGAGLGSIATRGGLPLVPPREAFAHASFALVALYPVLFGLAQIVRALRWRHLLHAVGHVSLRAILGVSFIGYAAILLGPLRSGEFVRPLLISRRGGVRLLEATGTIGAERVIDGLAVNVILFAALRLATTLDPLPDRVGDLPVSVRAVPGAAYTMLAVFTAAFAAMALFYWRRELARRITFAILGVFSRRAAEAVATAVERLAQGLRFLPSPGHVGPYLAETLAYWGLNAVGLMVLARGVGLEGTSLAQAAVVLGCIGLGVLVPSGPGFFGAFQLAMFLALAMFFPEAALRGPGAAFVFLTYTFQVAWTLLAAVVGALLYRAAPDAENLAQPPTAG
jgi:uncharacterized protein (TIRG00374 family)